MRWITKFVDKNKTKSKWLYIFRLTVFWSVKLFGLQYYCNFNTVSEQLLVMNKTCILHHISCRGWIINSLIKLLFCVTHLSIRYYGLFSGFSLSLVYVSFRMKQIWFTHTLFKKNFIFNIFIIIDKNCNLLGIQKCVLFS